VDVLREVIEVTKGKGKASQQAMVAPCGQVAQVGGSSQKQRAGSLCQVILNWWMGKDLGGSHWSD
jgi:hypothetical protein